MRSRWTWRREDWSEVSSGSSWLPVPALAETGGLVLWTERDQHVQGPLALMGKEW